MKKFLTRILICVGILVLVVLFLLTEGAKVVTLLSYVGNGSIARGIFLTPFFIFGIVQMIRSFLLLGNKVQQEAERGLFRFVSKKSDRGFDLGGLYIILSLVCYILVFVVIATPNS